MTWRELRLAAIREGIVAAIPCLVVYPCDDGFCVTWRDGTGVAILLPSRIAANDVPPAEVAINVAVESLMRRAPIEGRA